MYFFPIYHPIGLNDPIKLNPHFMSGYSRSVLTNFTKFSMASYLVRWQTLQDLQKSPTFLNRVGHWHLTFKIFLVVMFITKWPPLIPLEFP
jgi:hypothetical protein